MRMGIDWVATGVLGVAFVFSMIRTVPLVARHAVFALACFFIAGWRLRLGTAGYNMFFVALTYALGFTLALLLAISIVYLLAQFEKLPPSIKELGIRQFTTTVFF